MTTQFKHFSQRQLIWLALSLTLFLWGLGRLLWLPEAAIVSPGRFLGPTDLTAQLAAQPQNANLQAQWGLTRMQAARDTGQLAEYASAEAAFRAALSLQPDQIDALVGMGMLALVRHDFAEALEWAERARAQNPYRPDILGITVDAYAELGRYDEAVRALEEMQALGPSQATYSRVAYLRELHGDGPGAIAAMEMAAASGTPGSADTHWTQVQLGHLYFAQGLWDEAAAHYRQVLAQDPLQADAQLGLAQVDYARGDQDRAISALQTLVAGAPNPENVLLLADIYASQGRQVAAADLYARIPGLLQIEADAGIDIAQELAQYYADQGVQLAEAVVLARRAYTQRPTVGAAATLAWALHHAGDVEAAQRYSQESLRLGTINAQHLFQAGVIAQAAGQEEWARGYFTQALTLNPAFSVRYAAAALGP